MWGLASHFGDHHQADIEEALERVEVTVEDRSMRLVDLVYSFPKKFKRVCLSGHVTLRKFMEFYNILKSNFKKHNKCDFHQLKGID